MNVLTICNELDTFFLQNGKYSLQNFCSKQHKFAISKTLVLAYHTTFLTSYSIQFQKQHKIIENSLHDQHSDKKKKILFQKNSEVIFCLGKRKHVYNYKKVYVWQAYGCCCIASLNTESLRWKPTVIETPQLIEAHNATTSIANNKQ